MKDNSEELEIKEDLSQEEITISLININTNISPINKNVRAQEFDFGYLNFTDERFFASNSSARKKLATSWKDIHNLPVFSSKENISRFDTKMSNETSNSSDALLLDCPTTPLIDQLIVISHLLLAINSSANVIIYLFIGE